MGNDTYPPHPRLGCGKGKSASGSHVHVLPIDEGGTQLYPGDPGRYPAAASLPAGARPWPGRTPGAQGSKFPCAHHRPTHIRQILGRFHLTRPQTLVPRVCLLVLLATRTTHLAVLDRHGFVRAACHQTRPFPAGSAALSFTQITATTRGSGSLTPIRKSRASWRTLIR